ncbi:MAG: hypothetical protein LBK44_03590, partial [Spirochaetales bacterium]|nr:hypothetical protein [Spirochaetales bacterium]
LYRLHERVNPNYTIPNPSYDPLLPAGSSNPPRKPDLTSTYTDYDKEKTWSEFNMQGQIQRLISIDTDADSNSDEFFAATGTPTNNSYQLFRCSWTGGLTIQKTGLSGEIITGGTYDGSHYWFVSRSHVFRIAFADISSIPDVSSTSSPIPLVPSSKQWEDCIVWELTPSAARGFDLSIQQYSSGQERRLSRFGDIFYDDGTLPVLSSITSSNYAIANPNLYIACQDGIFMARTGTFPPSSGTPWVWDRLGGGYYTSIAKITDSSTSPTTSRLIAGREDSGLVEFEMRAVTGGQEPYGHYPYGRYSDFSSLYNASVTRLLADGPIVIAGTTRSGAWNGDYSSGITSPIWSQE